MTELAMPSKVMDKKLVQKPEGNVVDSDEEWGRCGKWMLYHPRGDLEFLDSAWTALQHLLQDGTLILLKATTGLVAGAGVSIYCFTRPGKQEARRAATAIRMLVDFKGIMYYKLNEPPQGTASRYGDRRLSVYMQTLRGGFYTKKNGAWMQDNEDVTENAVPIASKFLKENYSGDEILPSRHEEECFLRLPENHKYGLTGYSCWHMFCSCEDGGAYLTEVDRVWLVAKQLLEEGFFVGITLSKSDDAAHFPEVRFYVPQDCDVVSRLTACDRILKEASCKTVMYFTEIFSRISNNPERHNTLSYDYKYTSEGELYRVTEHAEEYVFV